jgi:hypothetical protein
MKRRAEDRSTKSSTRDRAKGKIDAASLPRPGQLQAAEQAREAEESRRARTAQASNRERMVDIGRGNQQAGRQGS